jgi:hypothetical protein
LLKPKKIIKKYINIYKKKKKKKKDDKKEEEVDFPLAKK